MSPKDLDSIFLKKLAQGDHDSFQDLFMEYFPRIKFFIIGLIKDEMISEELSQDVFTQLWINRENMPEIRSLNSYIYRMAKNAALQYLNRRYLEINYILNLAQKEEAETHHGIEEELFARETKLLILLTVENMPKQRRTIFEMSRFQHLKNDAIANILDISPKTVENHLTLALKQIRDALKTANILLVLISIMRV